MSSKIHENHEEDDDDHPPGQPRIVKPKLKFKDNKALFIKTKIRGFLKLLWNNKKKECLGRDGEDWAKLGAFYVVFYLIAGAFTWCMMLIFWGINNAKYTIEPKYPGLSGVLTDGNLFPGMGVRPHLGSGKSEIKFAIDATSDYTLYLDEFLKPYENAINNTVVCNNTQHLALRNQTHQCKYDVFTYLKQLNCSKEDKYGYASGQPCVLLKINNVFDWKPLKVAQPPSNSSYITRICPTDLTPQLTNLTDPFVYITCEGATPGDDKNVNNMWFNSPIGINNCVGGIPFYFYPFFNAPNYMQPLVVLKLDLKRNTKVDIQCRAWAKNIKFDAKSGYGTVAFSVTVNNPAESDDSVL